MTLNFQRTFFQSPGRPARDFSECTELERWIQSGGFTFLVGPGCNRIGSDHPAVMRPIAESMAVCFKSLKEEEDQAFLAMVATRFFVDLVVHVPENRPTHPLDGFRRALVAAARLATTYLASEMGEWEEPILDWDRHAIALPKGRLDRLVSAIGDLTKELERPIEFVAAASRRAAEGRRAEAEELPGHALQYGFGVAGVNSSLLALSQQLTERGLLRGTFVEWLTSLLWHSFRYEATWFPSTDELAFQLAMAWEDAQVTEVPAPALATQQQPNTDTTRHALKHILGLCERGTDNPGFEERRRLYAAIARHVVGQWVTVQSRVADNPELTGWARRGDKSGGSDSRRTVGAFTSNFDGFLEQALVPELAAVDPTATLHKIAPVYLKEAPSKDEGIADIGWAIGTLDAATWTWKLMTENETFRGPVVVKLNGDPDVDHVGGLAPGQDAEPILVVSEFQHLSMASGEWALIDKLSRWLLPELGRFVVLGESVDEWSIRQRIFAQVMYALQRVTPPTPSNGEGAPPRRGFEAISINRRSDDLNQSLFAWVNLVRYRGDLTRVTRRLEAEPPRKVETA